MQLFCWLCICALGCGNLRAETRWIRIRSQNFEIYSTASEGSARDALRHFEQVRAFFLQSASQDGQQSAPVRIIAFNSQKEYEPYRFNEFAAAYYYPGVEGDTIVMSHLGAEAYPVAVHEYVHLVVEHLGLQLPPWLNEGMAELHSTLREAGDKTVVGDMIPGRHAALLTEKWVPLAAILAADHNSPYYNEKNKAGALYNEGWALTHMLILSQEYRPKFTLFLLAVANGKDSVQALVETYRKPLPAIEKDLQAYLHGNRFLAAVVPSKLEKITQELNPEPAPAFDVKLALLDLTNRRGKEEVTRRELATLMAEAPQRPEPYVELGYLEWRQGNNTEAVKQLEKAFALGDRSRRMLWDYGRMIEFNNPQQAGEVFQELLDRQPQRAEVRIELAAALLNANQAVQAIHTLNQLTAVTHDQAPRYFTVGMFAALKIADRDQARIMAERLLAEAKSGPDERKRAEEVLSSLNQPAVTLPPVLATRLAAPPADQPEERPTLTRRPSTPDPTPPTLVTRMSVSGMLVEFVCDKVLKIVVETPAGRKSFDFEDPKGIVVMVNGLIRNDIELTCGPQKRVPVKVDYNRPAQGNNADGRLVVLHFE